MRSKVAALDKEKASIECDSLKGGKGEGEEDLWRMLLLIMLHRRCPTDSDQLVGQRQRMRASRRIDLWIYKVEYKDPVKRNSL